MVILNVVRLSFRIVFCLFLIIFVWREHDKTKSSFDIEKGYEDFERVCACRGGGDFVRVFGGFQKWVRSMGGGKTWL